MNYRSLQTLGTPFSPKFYTPSYISEKKGLWKISEKTTYHELDLYHHRLCRKKSKIGSIMWRCVGKTLEITDIDLFEKNNRDYKFVREYLFSHLFDKARESNCEKITSRISKYKYNLYYRDIGFTSKYDLDKVYFTIAELDLI